MKVTAMTHPQLSLQKGLTLIELMIAMTLSLLVMGAVGTILVNSNQAASLSDTLSQTQETGRFAADYMNRQLLRTGYDPDESGLTPFAGLCVAATEERCIWDSSAADTGDKLAIQRIAVAGEDTAVTCYGSALEDENDNDITVDVAVMDVYWVEVDGNGLSNLRCESFDINGTAKADPGDSFGSSQALAAGVAAMHVLFGQSTSAPEDQELNVSRYLAATEVTDWNNVYAMQIGFLTQAMVRTEAPAEEREYVVLNSPVYDFTDQVSRQVFSTTVTLLNY